MNYDDWKLASPDEGEIVSACCGADTVEGDVSTCCGASMLGETDICGECKEHSDTEEFCCEECGEPCELIDEEEYRSNMRESYLEDLADEQRLNDRE
tara:strand:+ start:763 stop:1053 length:291 start_codon:yes stop_codon:yes gene_type:complete